MDLMIAFHVCYYFFFFLKKPKERDFIIKKHPKLVQVGSIRLGQTRFSCMYVDL